MTTPTPTAQDGERERTAIITRLREAAETELLLSEANHSDGWSGLMDSAADMLSADAAQSAELAALRAQVESARIFLAKVRKVTESDEYLGMFTFCMVHGVLYRGDNFKAEADALSDALASKEK